jgi:hypothetical protein
MWKNIGQQSKPQMTIRRMRTVCWIPKATNTHSSCVILNAFPLFHNNGFTNAPQCYFIRTLPLLCIFLLILVHPKTVCKTAIHYFNVTLPVVLTGNNRLILWWPKFTELYEAICFRLHWLTFWHRSFTFNSNKSPTWNKNFSVYYPYVCLQLNMFRVRVRARAGRPDHEHDYHHDTKVKPEAATAVIELLMVGGKTPETCWAANKRQNNKLKNWCIRLVIYLKVRWCTDLQTLNFTFKF